MPTSKEVVPNKPLAGHELKEIMEKDFASMLRGDGMFSAHMAYRRVAYSIEIKLHVDNPLYPEHKNKRDSRDPARNATDPMDKINAPPLKNAGENSSVVAFKRERKIDSPNQARLEQGLPVSINVINRQSGMREDKQVQYDKEGVPPTQVTDSDTSDKVANDWGVKR